MTAIWRSLGRYDVLLLLDGRFETTSDVLVHAIDEEARRRAVAAIGPKIEIDVNCFALRSEDGFMLVDAGTGSAWGPHLGHARAAMTQAGIAPETVTTVLLTHIHGDHALGLFEGSQGIFPEARIMVPEADLAYFTDAASEAAAPPQRRSGFEIARRLLAVYGDRLHPIPVGPVLPQIEALALPGHTPGHGGYLIGSTPRPLLLCGDVLHLAEAQTQDPALGLHFDVDPPLAVETRQAMLAAAATEGWLLGGGHIHGFGHVMAEGSGFRFEPV